MSRNQITMPPLHNFHFVLLDNYMVEKIYLEPTFLYIDTKYFCTVSIYIESSRNNCKWRADCVWFPWNDSTNCSSSQKTTSLTAMLWMILRPPTQHTWTVRVCSLYILTILHIVANVWLLNYVLQCPFNLSRYQLKVIKLKANK